MNTNKTHSVSSFNDLGRLFDGFVEERDDGLTSPEAFVDNPTTAIDTLPTRERVTPVTMTDGQAVRVEHAGASPKGRTLLSPTGLAYLTAAVEKGCEPMHPNFRRALETKPKQLQLHLIIKTTIAASYDIEKDAKRAVIRAAQTLVKDRQAYVTFWKGLIADATFAAHMDAGAIERNGTQLTESDVQQTFDALAEDDPPFDTENAAFDAGHTAPSEPYEGRELQPTIGTDIEDVYDSIDGLREWCALAFVKFTPDDLAYWGLCGNHGCLPFAQERMVNLNTGEVSYRLIDDFDDYRNVQNRQYQAKRNAAAFTPDVAKLMSAA